MTAPPGHAPTNQTPTGMPAGQVGAVDPDVAAYIADHKARGKYISPSRARREVAAHLAAADRRHDRASDPDRDSRILGIHPDPTPHKAIWAA